MQQLLDEKLFWQEEFQKETAGHLALLQKEE
jgi:hypothetical protein